MSGDFGRTWDPTATLRRPAVVDQDDEQTTTRRSAHLRGRQVQQQPPVTRAYGGGEYGSRRTTDDVAARTMRRATLESDDDDAERAVDGSSYSRRSAQSMTSSMPVASANPMANLPPETMAAMQQMQSTFQGLVSGMGRTEAGETIAKAVTGQLGKIACWSLWDLTYKPENQKVAGLICRILYIVASILTFGALSIVDQIIQAVRRQVIISKQTNYYGLVFGNISALSSPVPHALDS